MTPRQLDREAQDERDRQIVAVLGLLTFVLLIGLAAGFFVGAYTAAADYDLFRCASATTAEGKR
jgi:hypothetical protein